MAIATSRFVTGPAATISARFHKAAHWKLPSSLGAEGSGTLAGFMSPWNCTYPPKGSAESFQRVPRLSVKPAISLPKPTEKLSARTPNKRPTSRWPSSCSVTSGPSTSRKPTTYIQKGGLSNKGVGLQQAHRSPAR